MEENKQFVITDLLATGNVVYEMKTAFTLVLSYYENPDLLESHIKQWGDFPPLTRVLIVDDGSKTFPISKTLTLLRLPCRVEVYRINEDIKGNALGARNLGMREAAEGWCLVTDMDHLLAAEDAWWLVDNLHNFDEGHFYRPMRIHQGNIINYHSDTFLLQKILFWRAGGYNEALVDYYYNAGWQAFRRQLRKKAYEGALGLFPIHYIGKYGAPKNRGQVYTGPKKDRVQFNFTYKKLVV